MKYILLLILSNIFILVYSKPIQQNNPTLNARVTVIANDLNTDDTLSLFLFDKNYLTPSEAKIIKPVLYRASNIKNEFRFTVEIIDSFNYFVLSRKGTKIEHLPATDIILEYYLLGYGDDILITLNKTKFNISGKGAAKLQCRQEIEDNYARLKGSVIPPQMSRRDNYFEIINYRVTKVKELINVQSKILKRYQPHLSTQIYQVLYADMIGLSQNQPLTSIINAVENGWVTQNDTIELLQRIIRDSVLLCNNNYNSTLARSKNYVELLFNLCLTKYYLNYFTPNRSLFYYVLRNNSTGSIRDKLLSIHQLSPTVSPDSIINDALSIIQNNIYKELINKKRNARTIGKPAPDFTLFDANNKRINLKDFKGMVVFLDFWDTGCTPCAWYYKFVVSKAEEHFKEFKNVVFLTISADTNRDIWIKSVQSNRYCSPKMINLFVGEEGPQHSVFADYLALAFPRPVLIDKNGNYFSVADSELGRGENGVESLISTIESALRN